MAKHRRPHIALFFLGGSVIDERGRRGDLVVKSNDIDPWMEAMSEMDIIGQTEGFFISGGTEPVGVKDWVTLSQEIKKVYDRFDGFVVIHQLETLPAAATALSLICQGLEKPIVLVGSPLRSKRDRQGPTTFVQEFGAKASFINAVQVAVSDAAEVLVVYGSHILRGPSVRVNDAHTALIGTTLGRIDFGIRLFDEQVRRAKRSFQIVPSFDTKIAVADYVSGMDSQHLVDISQGAHALFLSSAEPGALGHLLPTLAQRLGPNFPIGVFLSDQKKLRLPVSVLQLVGPVRSAALVRFMWALGQTHQSAKLKKLLTISA